jgi:hypothetical protein
MIIEKAYFWRRLHWERGIMIIEKGCFLNGEGESFGAQNERCAGKDAGPANGWKDEAWRFVGGV